jgi:hypothetical protein
MTAPLRTDAFIDGAWTKAGATFTVRNPATGEALAEVADLGPEAAAGAIAAAAAALPAWSAKLAKDRAAILRRWGDLIVANAEPLARLITAEGGKPLGEARGEVLYGASFAEWFAEEAKRAYGRVIPTTAPQRRYITIKQPVGVVAAITPWNFPLAMITRKAAPALAAGCTLVLKPAELTPLTALALAELAAEAGVPPGVFNVVTTSRPAAIGKVLCDSPIVRKLSFTGSTAVGKLLAAPLPEEPVGVGATWDTTTVVEQNGMRLTQIAHYKLLSRTRTRAALAVTIEQQAQPQTIVANGIKLELTSYRGGGAGQTALDLGMLVPRRSTVKVHSALRRFADRHHGWLGRSRLHRPLRTQPLCRLLPRQPRVLWLPVRVHAAGNAGASGPVVTAVYWAEGGRL